MQKPLSNNPDAVYTRAWRVKNKEKVAADRLHYREARRIELAAKSRTYYAAHKEERSRYSKQHRLENIVRIQHYDRQRKWEQPEHYLFYSAKHRAKVRGLAFTLCVEDIHIPTVCPVLGIPLFKSDNKFSPNSPTLDRIDNTKGYTKENVIVVSFRANNLKSDATPVELKRLAIYYAQS